MLFSEIPLIPSRSMINEYYAEQSLNDAQKEIKGLGSKEAIERYADCRNVRLIENRAREFYSTYKAPEVKDAAREVLRSAGARKIYSKIV